MAPWTEVTSKIEDELWEIFDSALSGSIELPDPKDKLDELIAEFILSSDEIAEIIIKLIESKGWIYDGDLRVDK